MFVGARHGYLVAGLLGGIVSSTSVTLSFSRASRTEDTAFGRPLAFGVIGACTVLFVRVMTAVGVLYPPLAMELLQLLAAPFLVGVVAILLGLRRVPQSHPDINAPKNPLQFGAALQMALLFQVVLLLVAGVRAIWGDVGLVVSGAILGLADVDALMISMARTAEVSGAVGAPALSVAVGILSNTLLKLTLSMTVARAPFRLVAGAGLALMAAASLAAILVYR